MNDARVEVMPYVNSRLWSSTCEMSGKAAVGLRRLPVGLQGRCGRSKEVVLDKVVRKVNTVCSRPTGRLPAILLTPLKWIQYSLMLPSIT